jgi:hypothetical protein
MTTPTPPQKRPYTPAWRPGSTKIVDRCIAAFQAWLCTNTRAGREFVYKQSLMDDAATYFADVDRNPPLRPTTQRPDDGSA